MTWNKMFYIGERPVGEGCPCFIIAEAGVAHFGSSDKALALVDLAVDAKADAVKFQTFRTDELISGSSGEWKDRLRPRELPPEAFADIRDYCRDKGIMFMSTAHDEPSLDAVDALGVPAFKIGSGELSNWDFTKNTASRGRPVILSTGMYTLNDVGRALDAVAETGNRDLAVLHCVTSYPTPPSQVNLRAMLTIRDTFGVVAGYSDHTAGFHLPLAAAALGAKVIEKHITLDFDIPNAQDWKVSCGPDDLRLFVSQVRDIEAGLGTGIKTPGEAEAESVAWARKSLVAARDLSPGEVLTPQMLKAKRPGTGISPEDMDKVLGRKVKSEIKKDTLITWEHLA